MLILPMTFDVASFLQERFDGGLCIEWNEKGEDGSDEKEKDPKEYRRYSFLVPVVSYESYVNKVVFPQVFMSVSERYCVPLDMPPEC